MSISTGPVSADYGLQNSQQRSQKIVQPAAGRSAQGEVSTAPAAKVAADAREGEAARLGTEQIRKSLEEINNVLAGMSISVQFQIDPNYKDVIVKVVDQNNDKVILQIPSMEVVRIAKAMDSLKGLLFSQAV
ncbi:flagellar protein FlaG [Thiobacillus denitrificans]|uniref:flagellar protein FlaG n=1 Tax=Thiobacillus denitrificans TaxID=36861 RepID=UPI000A59D88E|nr:flagellar protein FlaG [Thiobacillus denitrificans]